MQKRSSMRTRLILGLAGGVVVWLFQFGPAGRLLEQKGLDLLFILRGPLSTPEDLLVVAVDDLSFRELNLQWPWPRSVHARLIDRLHAAGARVIGFDILFSEPSAPAEDAALVNAVARAGNVVLASDHRLLETTRVQQVLRVDPFPALQSAAAGVGVVNQILDGDGVIRHAQTSVGQSPSLAAEVVRLAGGRLPRSSAPFLVNHLGPSPAVDTYSYASALSASEMPDSKFRGRIVFVGRAYGAAGRPVDDAHYTPYFLKNGRLTPGVEVHALIVDTLLRDRAIVAVGGGRRLAWAVVVMLVVALAVGALGPWGGLAAALGVIAVQAVVALTAFQHSVVWIAWVTPAAATGIAYVSTVAVRWRQSDREKRFIRGAFQRYVHPAVVQQIVEDPAKLQLGGQSVDATVLFSDLAGFTRVAEGLTPIQLVGLLNLYFTAMTDIILANRGMLNQTMGDGILALWGVPLPNPEHPLDACRTALAMQERLVEFNREGVAAGRPALKMRIGIQTGEIVVGNIGSAERFSYGTVGDHVNLASRLEGVNKLYGTGIILGEDTVKRVREAVVLRELDLIRVVGRVEPIRIYECLGLRGAVAPEREPALAAFATGLRVYGDRDWKGALAQFEHALALAPGDGPSRLYAERAREFVTEPPPEDWDGVYTARSKEG